MGLTNVLRVFSQLSSVENANTPGRSSQTSSIHFDSQIFTILARLCLNFDKITSSHPKLINACFDLLTNFLEFLDNEQSLIFLGFGQASESRERARKLAPARKSDAWREAKVQSGQITGNLIGSLRNEDGNKNVN